MQNKKIDKYPITCLPSKNRKSEPPEPTTTTHAFWPPFLTSIFCVVRENQSKMNTTQTQIRIFYNLRFLHGGSGGSFFKNVAWHLQCGLSMTSNLAINCSKNISHEKRNFSFFQKNIFSFYKKRIFFVKIQWFLCVIWSYGYIWLCQI